MIAVVDYGVGNLFSLGSSLKFLGLECAVTGDKAAIRNADRIILPGVGAFKDAKEKLDRGGLSEILKEEAAKGKPVLGICLGMQLLFDKSLEYGEHEGLSLISGQVRPISEYLAEPLKIPHIGWNSLSFPREDSLFKYNKEGDFVYYVHSYCAKNCEKDVIARSYYGTEITGAVRRGNVMGTQFHPEKSGEAGLKILKAFSEI